MSTITVSNYTGDFDAAIYFTSDAPNYITANGTFQYTDTIEYICVYQYSTGIEKTYYPPDGTNVTIDFDTFSNDFESNTSLHGTITFIDDTESERPTKITAELIYQAQYTGTLIEFDVTGSSFSYSYGEYMQDDYGLAFYAVDGYTRTTEPENDAISLEKNVVYAYTGEIGKRVNVYFNGQFSRSEEEAPSSIVVNLYDSANDKTWPVTINGSYSDTSWEGTATMVGLEEAIDDVTSEDAEISFYDAFEDEINREITVSIYGTVTKTKADEEEEEPTHASPTRIYYNGEWKTTRAVIRKDGAWVSIIPKVIKP